MSSQSAPQSPKNQTDQILDFKTTSTKHDKKLYTQLTIHEVPTLAISIQHSAESTSKSNQTRINKRHPNQKGKSKIISVYKYIISYAENPKDSI